MVGEDGLSASARLLRGFATDFLTSHDTGEVERIMDPAYCLSIGGHVLDGRDAVYLPATAAQLTQFPGLCVTVHDVVLGRHAVAMRFTEHGVSRRNPACAAAWGGVTLFEIEDGRLRRGWAEEDYFARKRELRNATCDPVRAPHPAPWDEPCRDPDPGVAQGARDWLRDPRALFDAGIVEEISAEPPFLATLVTPEGVTVTTLFSAGPRGAFHAECHGTYAGGYDDIAPGLIGRGVIARMAGIFDVDDGRVVRAQVAVDRLGLHRQLLDMGWSGDTP